MDRYIVLSLFACCLLPLAGIAQEEEMKEVNPIYESVVFPDRTLTRRLEQADRLFESGRSSEAAQLLGNLLENANFAFLMPDDSGGETTDSPQRNLTANLTATLTTTASDHIIDRIRKLPREARESYAFQFEPIAKRLLENALATGSLEEIGHIAQKYFPTASGAAAVFFVGLSQFERGDYAAAFLTLNKLKRLHPALPDILNPVLEPMLDELQHRLQHVAEEPPSVISESAWLEKIGWRLPVGLPSQNPDTQAMTPLLEQIWTVPLFTQYQQERTTNRISRTIKQGTDVYIPASQPLVVGDLFVTRTLHEVIAANINTGKRLWVASEPQYRFPDSETIQPFFTDSTSRAALRFFFWHNRIAHQLSSDGERMFCIDGHRIDFSPFGRPVRLHGNRGDDLRYSPGSTLTARDLRTGQILWQVGKFPYVQKYFDALFAPRPGTPTGQAHIDDSIFTDDEKTLKETWFLGAPLPLQGRLYVIGETDGILRLFVLESQTGRLIATQTIAHGRLSVMADIVRRTYPMFPSASSGIVICPTGNKLVMALDATTLSPIWCFSYAPATPSQAGRPVRNLPRGFQGMDLNDNAFRQLFSRSGWQVPSMIVDRQRVLIAPPDQAALYCLDLLSGELLWQQTIVRDDALYVAGIQNDKAFLVTPSGIRTLEMKTGKDISYEGHRFPAGLRPAGVGVRNGDQYFIPFADGYLAIADWKEGTLTWQDSSGLAVSPQARKEATNGLSGSQELFSGMGFVREEDIFSPVLTLEDVFQEPMQFGNLVGIKGRFFSQSPTQVACFDQKEFLGQRAATLLRENPNDPEGLFKQGRILKSEGKFAEAIESFRASLSAKPTAEAADFLRKNLLEAMRTDFATWSHASQELESLIEFPSEQGAILLAQIEGILQSERANDLPAIVEKVFAIGQNQSVLVPVSSDHAAQLSRILGSLVAQQPALKATWEELGTRIGKELSETLPQQSAANNVEAIGRLSMFVHLFRNTGAVEKGKQMLREEYERLRLPMTPDLWERSVAVPAWSELSVPYVWKPGKVVVSDETKSYAQARPDPTSVDDDVDSIVARLVSNVKNVTLPRSGRNQLMVPFLGFPDPELSSFRYSIQLWGDDSFLCCSDSSGQEQWRIALPNVGLHDYGRLNTVSSEFCYVKGARNFLLFVYGNSMTAISVFPQPEMTPKILWTKTASSLLESQQSGDRRQGGGGGGGGGGGQNLTANASFPRNAVFVSPHGVCCWDGNGVFGLDPMTGQTLWVRKTPGERCSVLGDTDNLFLVFPDVRQVLAIDPASGRELAKGVLPAGGTYIFGTNIVCVKPHGSSNEFALYLCDLRDIHDRRARALSARDVPEGQTPEIPSTLLHVRINNTSLVQMLHGGRFLSVATWGTKSLQIYDLQTKKKLLPEENTMLRFAPAGNQGTMRCDVEFVEDHFLVLFTKDINIQRNSPEIVEDNGETYRRTYGQVHGGVPFVGVGEGAMMLFDSAGNPCWSVPTEIKNWCRLLDVPDRLPVMLFAASYTDKKMEDGAAVGENISRTAIMGIDKRSGERRVRSRVTTESYTPSLQPFRVSIDPQGQEITFMTIEGHPLRVVKATFTDEEP